MEMNTAPTNHFGRLVELTGTQGPGSPAHNVWMVCSAIVEGHIPDDFDRRYEVWGEASIATGVSVDAFSRWYDRYANESLNIAEVSS